jgi:hypothetical protein
MTRVKAVLIFLFFLLEVGRYLIRPVPRPRKLKPDTSVIIEISVVPIPTCSEVKKRALIIQKKKPITVITAVLDMRYIEFL